MRAAAAFGALVAVAVLSGCQTTMEKSAELERKAQHEQLAQEGISVAKQSPQVKVLSAQVMRGAEGAAVVAVLRNVSTRPLEQAPIEVTVRDAKGKVLYRNDAPGLDPSLTHVSLLMPGQRSLWVDDQVLLSGAPAKAEALVGDGTPLHGAPPQMTVSGTHLASEAGIGAGVAGAVANESAVKQRKLVVYAVARRGERIVAAARAVVPELAAHASAPFQAFFVGDARGARVQASAPASTF